MRVENRDGSTERKIVTAMIVSADVLGRLAPKWGKDPLRSKWSNLVGRWCVDYWNNYGRPPGSQIQFLFERWADESKDTDTVDLVEQYISSLSGQYESEAAELNAALVLDVADKYLNEVMVLRVAELVQGDISGGDLDRAIARMESWHRVETAAERPVDVLQDLDMLDAAMEESEEEDMITYPGDLGTFCEGIFVRDSFVTFMGPEKRGKTWALLDVAWTAMTQRRRVAFFGAGDMTRPQVLRRLAVRAAGRPIKPGLVRMPTKITRDPDEKMAEVEFEETRHEHRMTKLEARGAFERMAKHKVKSDQSYFRLACYPNGTLDVAGIRDELRTWERTGWGSPDFIVIDYADILLGPSDEQDKMEKINRTWMALRALSQTRHCCVVTATQTNSASYDAKTIEMKHFSDLKKKLAHVTAAIGLNQTQAEKSRGVTRWNKVVLREGANNPFRTVHLASCLEVGNPRVKSTF